MESDRVTLCFEQAGEQRRVRVKRGSNLRKALLKAGISPHNKSRVVSCQGFGTCGTCAVQLEGMDGAEAPIEPSEPGRIENWRLGFPPHDQDSGLRLACQLTVNGDLRIRKHAGFWGEQIEKDDES